MNKMDNREANIVKDPKLAKNRIFVGNLPVCTKDELESIALPYGKVLGSLVQKNFGFIQFESEEIANKAAQALHKSLFKGKQINVRNAGQKPPPKKVTSNEGASNAGGNGPAAPGNMPVQLYPNNNPDYNDCEIIVIDKQNTQYAEFIEGCLSRLNLRIDLLFPNEEVPLGKVLANISSRGCLYAVLVTPMHEEHRSITVNILYGQPAEHRNMPVDDAINLIAEDFKAKILRDNNMVPKGGNNNNQAQVIKERHPEAMQMILNQLGENMPLSVAQYDRVIKYLQEKREAQIRIELGQAAEVREKPDPEIELQKKILNILNKPSIAETHYELLYPDIQAVKDDYKLVELLRDEKVRIALDSIMHTSLVATIEKYMKF